jgi:hypothetical protein
MIVIHIHNFYYNDRENSTNDYYDGNKDIRCNTRSMARIVEEYKKILRIYSYNISCKDMYILAYTVYKQ